MKKIIITLLFCLPLTTFAAVTSWDFTSSILQPLQSQWAAQIKGSFFTSTSTTNKNTFPNASTTALTISGVASTTILRIDRLSDGCLNITTGLVGSQACASGGGSGSSPFATSTASGQEFIYPVVTTSDWILGASATGTSKVHYNNNGFFNLLNGMKLGIGTTSPYAPLSVIGQIVSDYFTATSTTATSTIAGALGIGTTTPYAKLAVTNTTNDPSFIVEDSTSPDQSPAIFVGADGRVGIATSTLVSGAELTVDGSISLNLDNTGEGYYLRNGQVNGLITDLTVSNDIALTSANNVLVLLDSNNNGTNIFSVRSGATTGGSATELFRVGETGLVGISSTTPFATLSVNPVAGAASNQFVVGSSTATALLINNTGNMGLNNLTPANTLSVNGSTVSYGLNVTRIMGVGETDTTSGTSANGVFLESAGGSNASRVFTNSSSVPLRLEAIGATSDVVLSASRDMRFYTLNGGTAYGTANERLAILSTGQVGVGTTSPFAVLSVQATAGGVTPLFVVSTSTAGAGTTSPLHISANSEVDFSGATSVKIVSGNAPVVDTVAEIALDATSPGSLVVATSTNAAYPGVMPLPRYQSFMVASTTWTSTSTMAQYPTLEFPERITGGQCYTNAGSVKLRIGDGTNWSNLTNITTATTTVTFTSNNTFNANGVKVIYEIGTPATSPTQVNCTVQKLYERI